MDTIEEALIGICPSCGKPLKIEHKEPKKREKFLFTVKISAQIQPQYQEEQGS